jgi:hypothetical protein
MSLRRTRALLLTLVLTGCGSSPEPAYFALSASPGTSRAVALGPVEIRQPGVAGYLDHSELLARSSGNELFLARSERWGEPLARMIGRVIAEDLSARLQGTVVFTETSGISVQPATLVEIGVERFDYGADRRVTLRAQLALHDSLDARPPTVRSVALSAAPTASTTGAIVGAMSALLGRLSDEIATMLVANGPPSSR